MQALITNVTIFEKPGKNNLKSFVVVCGDRHSLGSWENNINQFLGFTLLEEKTKLKTNFLVENLSSPNSYFNRPQDLAVLREKELYLLSNLQKNFAALHPVESTTILHLWGCSNPFFETLCRQLNLGTTLVSFLTNLPVTNIDNRHRTVYYAESLIGWNYGPYNHPKVKTIQDQEILSLTIFDLLSPQEILRGYIAQSSGWLKNIFQEIFARQESHTKKFLQNLEILFKIDENMARSMPIASLTGADKTALYRYLQRSSLQYVLREMIEANALWDIMHTTNTVTVVLAGTNHTGHTAGNWQHQTPGLTNYLSWLGFKKIFEYEPDAEKLRAQPEATAQQLAIHIPTMITQQLIGPAQQPQRL